MSDTTQTFQNLAPSAGAKFRQRTLPILIFAACLAAIPMVGPSRTFYTIAHQMGINIVFALSYNMILGRGGLLSFGHAVYFGLGGYLAMHAMNWIEAGSGIWGAVPVFFLPVVGFAGGALAGAIIGWPSCRKADPGAIGSLRTAQRSSSRPPAASRARTARERFASGAAWRR